MPKNNFKRVKIVLDIVEDYWTICYPIFYSDGTKVFLHSRYMITYSPIVLYNI